MKTLFYWIKNLLYIVVITGLFSFQSVAAEMTQQKFNQLTIGQKTWLTLAYGFGSGQQYRGLKSDTEELDNSKEDNTFSTELNYQVLLNGLITLRSQSWNHGVDDAIGNILHSTLDSVSDSQNLSGTEYALELGWISRGTLYDHTSGYWSASSGISYFDGDKGSWNVSTVDGETLDSGSWKSRNAVGIPFELQAFIYPGQSHFGIGIIGTALVTQYSTFESIMLGLQGRF
ncbi:hypothetical protein M9194_13205 [Vibrio sp. S4M6]|uniref:hypothetical protein n=1 Tax=Vibrio sinus TaxID=2946865 RepID=UPI00202A4DE0|nr:hypothetical protein [Vibrio sinus]MCL9782385.1 hypothetical protein [Vibrio sinus]